MSVFLTTNDNELPGLLKSLDSGLLSGAISISGNAKALSAVDKGQQRNSIMYRVGESTGNVVEGGFNDSPKEKADSPITTNPSKGTAITGTNVEYAVYNEFGTKYMAAAPFLRPAAQIASGKDAVKIAQALSRRYQSELKAGKKRQVKIS